MRVRFRRGVIVRTWILVLCVLTLLLSIAAGPSTATEPELLLPGPGGSPADIDRDVLWLDNPDFDEDVTSSEVIGAFDYWTETAEDFTIEMDATVRKVTWWGTYWNGFEGTPAGAGFSLRFYMEAGCLPEDVPFLEYLLPGDDCCEGLADGGDQFSQFVYECCLELPLSIGHYWFSPQMADNEFPPQGGRQGAAGPHQSWESMFRSPYFSYPEWVPAGDPSFEPWWASQMFEDECAPIAIENATWGAVRSLFR